MEDNLGNQGYEQFLAKADEWGQLWGIHYPLNLPPIQGSVAVSLHVLPVMRQEETTAAKHSICPSAGQ